MLIHKISYIGIVLFLVGLTASAQQPLTVSEIASLKEKMATSAKNLQSLESSFTQTKQLSYLEKAAVSSGKLYFKPPRKIRWEYTSPTPYTVIFNDDKMYTRNEAGKTSQTDLSANKRFNALNGLLTETAQNGNFFDENRFTIAYYKNGQGYAAVLIPKEKALNKYIRQIELAIDGTSFLVQQVKIVDPSSDYMQLDFANQRKNAPIPEDKFIAK